MTELVTKTQLPFLGFRQDLIPGYTEPLFRYFKVDGPHFGEVNSLPNICAGGRERWLGSIYLNHILSYVRAGIFTEQQLLRQLAAS